MRIAYRIAGALAAFAVAGLASAQTKLDVSMPWGPTEFHTINAQNFAKRVAEIKYVDMRYTNGFSVGWNARSALAVAPQEDATPDA